MIQKGLLFFLTYALFTIIVEIECNVKITGPSELVKLFDSGKLKK